MNFVVFLMITVANNYCDGMILEIYQVIRDKIMASLIVTGIK